MAAGTKLEACSCASEWRSSISTSASIRRKSDRFHLEDFTGIFLHVFGVPARVSVGMFLSHLVTAWTQVRWDAGKINDGFNNARADGARQGVTGWCAQEVVAPAPARAVPPQKEDCGVATQPNAASMPHGSRHMRNSARSLQRYTCHQERNHSDPVANLHWEVWWQWSRVRQCRV